MDEDPPGADAIIATLGLQPHPEGGWYTETWRADAKPDERASGTAIYFLLKADEPSHWHRVDAAEIWLWHAGAEIELRQSASETGPATHARLGPDLTSGARPQVVVPAHHWQAARSLGPWSLVSCVVAPGFHFEGFELAPEGFDIPS